MDFIEDESLQLFLFLDLLFIAKKESELIKNIEKVLKLNFQSFDFKISSKNKFETLVLVFAYENTLKDYFDIVLKSLEVIEMRKLKNLILVVEEEIIGDKTSDYLLVNQVFKNYFFNERKTIRILKRISLDVLLKELKKIISEF